MSNSITIVNPWTGQPTLELPVDDEAAIALKIEQARRQAVQWAKTTMAERIALVESFIAHVESGAEDVARAVTLQMGKPIGESRGEVRVMLQRAKMMAALAPNALRDEGVALGDGIHRTIVRDPLGVVLNIGAWNYPLLIVVNVIVPAVLSGNAVLLKHASQTAGIGLWFERMFREAGAPAGLVTALTIRGATASLVAQSPDVDGVFFTGSVEAGRAVYQAVGMRPEGFIDVGLELGGKDPAYVRSDMPLELVVANLVEGAMYNAGQSCCAVERIYVDRGIYHDFVHAYVELASGLQPADPMLSETRLGPLAAQDALDTLSVHVRDAVNRGATLHCGGERGAGPGWVFPATVLSNCSHDMLLMTEESFGPIIGIMPVDSDEEALALMNDTAYGLTASVWTADHQLGAGLARKIRTGTAFVNRCDYVDPALPWTGFGDTGKGITLSALGYHHLTRARGLHVRPISYLG